LRPAAEVPRDTRRTTSQAPSSQAVLYDVGSSWRRRGAHLELGNCRRRRRPSDLSRRRWRGRTRETVDFLALVQPVQPIQPKSSKGIPSVPLLTHLRACRQVGENAWTGWTGWTDLRKSMVSRVQATPDRLDPCLDVRTTGNARPSRRPDPGAGRTPRDTRPDPAARTPSSCRRPRGGSPGSPASTSSTTCATAASTRACP
jgi:hypothetical protein